MHILEKSRCDFLSQCEIWRVRPDTIDTEFQIFIVAPEGAWSPQTRFGVNLAIDAEQFGNIVPSMARALAAFGDIYPTYTVSIGYPPETIQSYAIQRTRDLTPTAWPEYSTFFTSIFEAQTALPTGQAEAFLNFITNELQPALNAAYPLDPQNYTLAGHELGGLLTLFALLKKPQAFQNYLAISPALWWQESALVNAARQIAATTPSPNATLYMCAGALGAQQATASLVSALPAELQSQLPSGLLDPNILGNMEQLENALAPWKDNGLRIQHAAIPNETQSSVVGAGISQGLRALHSLSQAYEAAPTPEE